MTTIPLLAAALLGAMQVAPTPAPQATSPAAPAIAAKPVVGAAVADQAGSPVGTIASINGGVAVIDTGTSKAGVPLAAIGPGPNGGLITTVTKAQLDAAAGQSAAQLKALLVPGASVRGANDQVVVGTIKAADEQYVTLTTPKGDVRFPVNAFAARPSGPIVSLTPEQFDAAVTQSLGSTAK